MNLSTAHRYLAAMDIQPWSLRRQTPAAVQATTPVVVVAQWPAEALRVAADHAGGDLLGKILSALQLDQSDYTLHQVRTAGEFEPAQFGQARVLAFVDGVADHDRVLGLPTLQRMLADRAEKKAAWDRLKPWVGKLTGG